MKKNYASLTKSTILLCCLLVLTIKSWGQILHSESFDGNTFLPTGWTAVGTAPDWARATVLATPLTGGAHTGAGFARMRYPANGTGATPVSESICTPKFDLSGRGANTPTVSLWVYRDSLLPANNDSIAVYISKKPNLTGAVELGVIARCRKTAVPDTTQKNGWYQYSFNIPVAFSTDSNFVIFKSTVVGPTATARRNCIDDVNWTEYLPACTGTPTPGTITSPDTLICNGKGVAHLGLNGASTGTGITYTWYTALTASGPWVPFGTNATTAVSDTLTSTHYFQCIVTCTASGLSDTSNVLTAIVNPNPNPVVTITSLKDTICSGDTLRIVAHGASTYLWTITGNPNYSTNDTINVFPNNTTTYSVTGKDVYGCKSAVKTKTVVVGRRPTITSITNTTPLICVGGSSTLTVHATTGGGGGGVTLSYVWNPTALTTAAITVSPAATSIYTVTVKGQYGCSRSDTSKVSVNQNWTSPTVTLHPDTISICQGVTTPVLLVATCGPHGASYAWTASSGVPVTSVNDSLTVAVPAQSVSYTVTGTDSNGCKAMATAAIMIRRTPTTTITTANQTICKNGNAVINLAIGNTGGAAASSYTSLWSPSGLSGIHITESPSVTTTYTVVVTSAYGCTKKDSVKITVDTTKTGPVIALSPSSVHLCSAALSPVQLVASSAPSNVSFAWTPAITSTNDTVTVNPTNSTTYTVKVTDTAGCSSSAIATVVVSPSPVVTLSPATASVCPGAYAQLIASSNIAGTTYAWAPSISSTNDTVMVMPMAATTYTVTGTSAAGCSSIKTSAITLSQLPVASFTDSVATSTVYFTNTTANVVSYNWTFGDGSSSTMQNPVHTYSTTGTYTVMLICTNSSGCGDSLVYTINITTTGISAGNSKASFIVFPNPGTGVFNVQFSSEESKGTVQVMNVLGSEILNRQVNASAGREFKEVLDLTQLPQGVYFITIVTTKERLVQRVVKQ